MSSSLNQLVSNFVQQSLVRAPDYTLYTKIKEMIPEATYEELKNSVTDNSGIRPLLIQEIKRRLNACFYIAKYSKDDNIVNIYVDYANSSGLGISPTPEVIAMNDCMAYVCFKIVMYDNDTTETMTSITNFTSLSHPEMLTKIGECSKNQRGMYYPVLVQSDSEDGEFFNLAQLYQILINGGSNGGSR
jgi:hypothetical protein